MGGGRNFERPNVERPIFRNLKITNVKNGWGTKFGTIKCRTTDMPEFQNYEY